MVMFFKDVNLKKIGDVVPTIEHPGLRKTNSLEFTDHCNNTDNGAWTCEYSCRGTCQGASCAVGWCDADEDKSNDSGVRPR